MHKWIYFLLIVCSFILYGNSIPNNYSLDDDYVVGNNLYVQKGLAGIPEILTNPYSVRGNIILDYRPVVLISFALEYQFFKTNPHISHFFNILLYALCLIVIYNLLVTVFNLDKIHKFLPLSILLFFAVHPIHTEVVNSLKNRDELFVLLFGVLFLYNGTKFILNSQTSKKHLLYSILFLMLCLLSKLNGILYFPILILISIFYKKDSWKRRDFLFLLTCLILLLVVLITVVAGVKRENYIFENPLIDEKYNLIYLSTVFKILYYNIKMLLIPFPLRFYYGYNLFPTKGITEPIVVISLILNIVSFLYGLRLFIQKNIVGLFILAYFASISLYSSFPIPYTGMFAERTLLLGSLWFIAICFISAFQCIKKLQILEKKEFFSKIILIGLILIFSLYSIQTIRRNFDWKNHLTLMSHDIPYLENSITANYIYANRLIKESDLTDDTLLTKSLNNKAIDYYKQAIKLYPYYPDFHFKVASIYQNDLNDNINAEKFYQNILQIDSTYFGANYGLAQLNFGNKNFNKSTFYFSKAYQKLPTDSLTLFYYAQSADAIGNIGLSFKLNNEFLKLYPDLPYPYMNLGVYYSKQLKDDTAVIYFEKAIELGERNPQLLKQLAIYYNNRKNNEKAAYFLNLLQQK